MSPLCVLETLLPDDLTVRSDERLVDVDVDMWRLKKEHIKAVKKKAGERLKIVLIYTGFFLEGIGVRLPNRSPSFLC